MIAVPKVADCEQILTANERLRKVAKQKPVEKPE